MSTQQILGVVGAVVGSFFGYPQLGFVVGSLVGAALTPKEKSEGPRIDDLEVTVSTYGGGIPTLYGTMRVGGNVIWSSDKIEIPTTQSSGKGGGSESTTYQYVVHMAVALCYGPINGIRKIWKDGKLVYDASAGTPIGSALASAQSPYSFATLYLGSETQMPDPIQEIYLGVGQAPAYRGIAYIQLNAVDCPGGRVPQFSFEISTSLLAAPERITYAVVADDPHLQAQAAIYANEIWQIGNIFFSTDYTMTVKRIGAGYASDEPPITLAGPVSTGYPVRIVAGAASPEVIRVYYDNGVRYYSLIDLVNRTERVLYSEPQATTPIIDNLIHAGFDGSNWVVLNSTGNAHLLPAGTFLSFGFNPLAASVYAGTIYLLDYVANALVLKAYDLAGTLLSSSAGPTNYTSTVPNVHLSVSANGVFVVLGTVYPTALGGKPIYKIVGAAWNLLWAASTFLPARDHLDGFYASDRYILIGPGSNDTAGGQASYSMIRFDAATVLDVGVADIIAAQCTRAGLTAAQFDTGTIADTVHGYVVTNPASARNNIQPLLTGYGIDATEEDGKVRFFKRSALASVTTVPYRELGCVEGDGEPGDPMPLARAQEFDLPSSVAVSYINPEFDYQTGTEKAIRQVTRSRNHQVIELPLATRADHAASVAQMILYDAHNERSRRSLKVSRRYAFASAGDGVTVEYPQGIEQRWRLMKVTDTGVLCEWEVVPADETIYTQTALGASGYAGQAQQVAPLPPATRMAILDMPIMRDADNDAGLYVALSGYGTGWPGAQLLVGDDAASLLASGEVRNEAPTAVTETLLGDWSSGTVDESNLLTVDASHHALESITRELLLAGASNVAAVGAPGRWEIIKFQRAAALGGGRYILSGLIRGARGTEHNRGNHAAGDLLVLLSPAGMLRPVSDVAAIGASKLYRAITTGASSGDTRAYTNTGEGLRPFSPDNARKAVSGGDITLTWDRRTRLTENWLAGALPLGEASERYEVDIYASSAFAAVKRTLYAASASVTYTAADQTADFGATQSGVSARIYQMSDAVGRGHALSATV